MFMEYCIWMHVRVYWAWINVSVQRRREGVVCEEREPGQGFVLDLAVGIEFGRGVKPEYGGGGRDELDGQLGTENGGWIDGGRDRWGGRYLGHVPQCHDYINH
jgi:hypothetical protein